MAIKTELVNGRDLKVGSIFIPQGSLSFYKITDISVSKPGKHGSSKNVVSAKDIVSGKHFYGTFKDTDEKLIQVLDLDCRYKVIYSFIDGGINTNLGTGENIYVQDFIPECQERLTEKLDEFIETGKGLIDGGAPLVIKYSDMGHPFNVLVFWELLYVPEAELPKYGIDDFGL
ncbi:MAG: hypothetical protein ACHWZW_07005 [Spirulina sp.]